jgi:hypothetical protein
MKKLYSELAYYKMLINSNYGLDGNTTNNSLKSSIRLFKSCNSDKSILDKAYQLRRRIITIKLRKEKIKRIFDER